MEEWRGMPVVGAMAEDFTGRLKKLADKGIVPTLAVVRVGDREDDLSYERGLNKRFDAVGAKVVSKVLPADVGQEELEKVVKDCDNDDGIHGILVFRPLPGSIDEKAVTALVSPLKDVDCMNTYNIAHTFMQDGMGHEPCTPRAVMELLKHYDYDLTGKNAVVVGRSMVVGKPLAMMLLKSNATVTICHTKTEGLADICKKADIICACAGVPGMITEEYMGEGQVLIDVGINVVDGKLVGDIDYEAAMKKAAYATPVPGGVGTVTTSCLLLNTIKSAENG
ncbi:MAG: bifunctional 5,10-methylenetetrahydrofolate dehydrogenase/5,10-methenyltetrahydrofolate cyclohydrolase [Lachnospiraceae bacterium]|nr:bifunctional 5,10-methylenetetrahydrofolate dehydrogenase/5,10-methenyltetrahydrofolate cyclohydrolase [Lachnospiraceae bacterium]